jgi:RimJ/RimL family protein N-acetyltransferase
LRSNPDQVDSLEPPFLAAGQVVLRGWRTEDAEALRPACGDPDVCRFTTVPHTYTIEAAQAWIARQHGHAHNGTAVVWAVVPNAGEQPVGMVGLFGLGEPEPEARFGYWLVSTWRRRGLASAATALVAEWGFAELDLRAIHIDREPANRASAAVAERLGAEITGPQIRSHRGDEVELIRHTLKAP